MGKTVVEEVADQCAERPPESRHARDTDIEMDLGEGTPNDPTPPESSPKSKYAFVKLMELDEQKMLTSYLGAWFGEPDGVWIPPSPFPI